MRDCVVTHSEQLQNLSVTYVHVLTRLIGLFKVFHTFSGSRVLFMVYSMLLVAVFLLP